jgi:hypothetical protein
MSSGKISILAILSLAFVIVYANASMSDHLAFHGKVTHSGVPLNQGLVFLHPEEGTESQIIAAFVESGVFHVDSETGPVPGKYRVEVYRIGSDHSIDPSFPKQYNEQSKMELEIPNETELYAEFEL